MTIEDPQPICSSQAIEDDPYVFIPFGADEQMQFRNFLDGWYAKETSSQFDALKEALAAYPVEVQNVVCRVFPCMNQATVITSPILANCLGTNTNAIPLGSTEQAKAIMYYLIKYILKDKTALKSTLSVVSYALKKLAEQSNRHWNRSTIGGTFTTSNHQQNKWYL